MDDVAQPLGRALRAGAAQESPIRVPDHGAAALRADGGQPVGHGLRRAAGLVHRHHLRDDLPGLLHPDRVPDAHVQPVDEVLVVQRGVGDRGARQADGFQHRLGRQHPGPPHLHGDVQDAALLFLRGIFVGHCPAGGLGRAAQGGALGQVVQFDHRAVHLIGKGVPVFADPVDLLHTGADVVIEAEGHHLEAHVPQSLQRRGMAGVVPGGQLHVVDDQVQPPLCRHPGVQLPQGARRRVAGVGQRRLAADLPLGVQGLEILFGDVDLPPDDEPLRRVLQLPGQTADGAEVLGHVLPRRPVAPGGAPEKDSVPVLHGDGKPVNLRLHVEHALPVHGVPDPLPEGKELLPGKHVRQALQRHRMGHRGKLLAGPAAHALGGRVGTEKLRVLPLQVRQFVDQAVVFKVGDRRRVFLVIAPGVFRHRFAQRFHLLFCFRSFHGLPPNSCMYPARAPRSGSLPPECQSPRGC